MNFCLQKQDGKDTSIQKRLSWNYGQHIPTNELSLQQQRLPAPSRNKCLSSDSMHSSSGVSSTGSLHLSIGSEWEDSTASTGTVVTATHIYRNLSTGASQPKENENGNFFKSGCHRKVLFCKIKDLVYSKSRNNKFSKLNGEYNSDMTTLPYQINVHRLISV